MKKHPQHLAASNVLARINGFSQLKQSFTEGSWSDLSCQDLLDILTAFPQSIELQTFVKECITEATVHPNVQDDVDISSLSYLCNKLNLRLP
ncbi:MAG: hypothetical protein AAFW67_12705 [Cyanobacteria bacterium J06638_38]